MNVDTDHQGEGATHFACPNRIRLQGKYASCCQCSDHTSFLKCGDDIECGDTCQKTPVGKCLRCHERELERRKSAGEAEGI